MIGYSADRARWMDPGCVPVAEVLGSNLSQNAVLLVDVGGGSGHDIELFQKRHPGLPGRLVLQDLPTVIEAYKGTRSAGIEVMGYDFFTPQPIKGVNETLLWFG